MSTGISFFQLCQRDLYALLQWGGNDLRSFPLIRLCAVDVDGVGDGIVGYAEVDRFADVSEPDVVVASGGIGDHGYVLAVHVDRSVTECGSDRSCRLRCRTAQGESGQDADPHKNCFSRSAHDDLIFPSDFYVPLASSTIPKHWGEVQIMTRRKTAARTKHFAQ